MNGRTGRDEDADMIARMMKSFADNVADHPAEAGGLMVMGFMATVIAANALWLQPGQHPAPLFVMTAPAALSSPPAPALERPAKENALSPSADATESANRTNGTTAPKDMLVMEIQSLLQETGHYTGTVDGIAGPGTRRAIESFETEIGLPVTGVASFPLLADIENRGAANGVTAPDEPSGIGADPEKELIFRVQSALKSAGYELAADGIAGPQTVTAIRTYQKRRGLDVDGQISNRLIRDLYQMGDYSLN